MKLILLFALIIPVAAVAQTHNYNVNLNVTHSSPGYMPINYASPLQNNNANPMQSYFTGYYLAKRFGNNSNHRRSKKSKSNYFKKKLGLKRTGYRNENNEIRYIQYDITDGGAIISDSVGNIINYLVPVSKKRINVLDSKSILIEYMILKGKKIKLYSPSGDYIKNVKLLQ
jgi:hypothetical protein